MPNPLEISVVIPVLDEKDTLYELHRQLSEVLAGRNYEIIFIDDGSRDGSTKIMREIVDKDEHSGLIEFRRNRGKSAALSAGFLRSRGNVVITIDADLQDDPLEIPHLLNKLDEGYDLVSGWKAKRHDPLTKTLPSKFFNWVTSRIFDLDIHDANCGLKAYRREVVEEVKIYGQMHRYIPALAKLEGFTISEVKVVHHPRRFGKTKYGASRLLYGFLDLLTVIYTTKYTKRPLHLFGMLGILSVALGVIIDGYLTIGWFAGKYINNRPLFFLGILLIILGVQVFSMGLLGEMITRQQGDTESERGIFKAPRI